MAPKNRLRLLLFLLLGLAFAVTQDRYIMRRLMRHGAPNGTVHWQTSFDTAVAQAQREHKPLFLDFSATWCGPCQDMQQTTYRDPDVADILNNKFVPVLIDIDQQKELAARFGVSPIPDEAFVASDGDRELVRTAGYNDADDFLNMTDKALKAFAKLPPPDLSRHPSSASTPSVTRHFPVLPPDFP